MSDKDKSQEETTLNETNYEETPPKFIRFTKSEEVQFRRQTQLVKQKELERIIANVKSAQMEVYQEKLQKLISNQKVNRNIMLSVLLIFVCLLTFLAVEGMKSYTNLVHRVGELEHSNKVIKEDIKYLHKLLAKEKDFLFELNSSYENLKEEIYDIHMNQLIKEQKSMHIFRKYSQHFEFSVNDTLKDFDDHFKIRRDGIIKKKSDQVKMFSSFKPIPQKSINYLQIQIVETLYGMISFGVMPKYKVGQDCVYCDSSQMLYFYCKDGSIYNGNILGVYPSSHKTRFNSIKAGDILTMFIDNKSKDVVWYINSRYAGSESIRQIEGQIYPFIQMTSRGDEIRIIE